MDVESEFGQGMELRVIGTVSGGPGNVVWCPFFLRWEEENSELFWVDSCSFDIADNARLSECKAAIYEIFVEPGEPAPEEEWTYGVLVQDLGGGLTDINPLPFCVNNVSNFLI